MCVSEGENAQALGRQDQVGGGWSREEADGITANPGKKLGIYPKE